MSSYPDTLQKGATIGCYQIEEVLGRGGFAVTYLAVDLNLDVYVAIKEYLPREIIRRNELGEVSPRDSEFSEDYAVGLENFAREAKTLALFKHPNIVRVHQVLHENNTAYMVMDYEHGRELAEVLETRKSLSEQDLRPILLPILDAVARIHEQGYVHRDIKPSNIYLRDNGPPVLLDFGAARYTMSETTQQLTAVVTVGYTPIEQYNVSDADQGPWTDIYALAAVSYEAVTGQMPVDSVTRASATLTEADDPLVSVRDKSLQHCSDEFYDAIDQALRMDPLERPQTIKHWLAALDGQQIEATPEPQQPQPQEPQPRRPEQPVPAAPARPAAKRSKLRTRAKTLAAGEIDSTDSRAPATLGMSSQGIDIEQYPDSRIEPSFGESLESLDTGSEDSPLHQQSRLAPGDTEQSKPAPGPAPQPAPPINNQPAARRSGAIESLPPVTQAPHPEPTASHGIESGASAAQSAIGQQAGKSHTQEIRDVVRRDIMKRDVDADSDAVPTEDSSQDREASRAASSLPKSGRILTRADAHDRPIDQQSEQPVSAANRHQDVLDIEETDWDYEPPGNASRWKWILPATGLAAVFAASMLYVNRRRF